MSTEDDYIRIASFDIGKKNFASYIEDCHRPTLEQLSEEYYEIFRTKASRINPLKEASQRTAYMSIIKRVCLSGNMVHTGVYDLRDDKTSDTLDVATRLNIIRHLESLRDWWDTCDVIIIEQQFFNVFTGFKSRRPGNSGGANVDALKIGEIVMTWFLMTYGGGTTDSPLKEIYSYGSQFKTQILGAPKRQTKAQRKTWSTIKTEELYHDRRDWQMKRLYRFREACKHKRPSEEKKREIIREFAKRVHDRPDIVYLAKRILYDKQKLDDISDTCMQCQAFKFQHFVAKTK